MGARWGKVVLMSFGRSHSLLCRERPERMWIDQLQYYRSNPVRGRRRFGTEEAEVRDILKTWTRLLGRLVLDGAWERECPGRRLGSELAQRERRWCQSLTVRHDAVQKAVMSYTGFTRLDQVTLGFISESIASLCLALCVFRACKWAFRGPSSLNWKILSAFSGGEVPSVLLMRLSGSAMSQERIKYVSSQWPHELMELKKQYWWMEISCSVLKQEVWTSSKCHFVQNVFLDCLRSVISLPLNFFNSYYACITALF